MALLLLYHQNSTGLYILFYIYLERYGYVKREEQTMKTLAAMKLLFEYQVRVFYLKNNVKLFKSSSKPKLFIFFLSTSMEDNIIPGKLKNL